MMRGWHRAADAVERWRAGFSWNEELGMSLRLVAAALGAEVAQAGEPATCGIRFSYRY
jgi:hypothetical protein